jgi:hypothetical protein
MTQTSQSKWERACAQYKEDHPGEDLPTALKNWLINMPDEKDLEQARKRLDNPDIRFILEKLNGRILSNS